MAKKNYYAVKVGRVPGIYKTWDECSAQVTGFAGARYRGFNLRQDAEAFLQDSVVDEVPFPTTDENAQLKKVFIYTDGTSIGNPGIGGYAAVLIYGNTRKELSGGFCLTTSARMELMAALAGLGQLKTKCAVTVYSDSKYLVESVTQGWVYTWRANGWMKKDDEKVPNADLWKQLLEQCEKHAVTFEWIAGHEGKKENERCDALAAQAVAGEDLLVDWGYEERYAAGAPSLLDS